MYNPRDPPLVLHMLTSWQLEAEPVTSLHASAEVGLGSDSNGQSPKQKTNDLPLRQRPDSSVQYLTIYCFLENLAVMIMVAVLELALKIRTDILTAIVLIPIQGRGAKQVSYFLHLNNSAKENVDRYPLLRDRLRNTQGGISPDDRTIGSGTLHNACLWHNFSCRRGWQKSTHILIANLYCTFIWFDISKWDWNLPLRMYITAYF